MSSKTIPVTLVALAVASLCHAQSDSLPMAFEANQGQTDAAVKFLSHGRGYGLYLTSDAAVLSLRAPGQQSNTVVRMEIAGASSHAGVAGTDSLQSVSNYYLGSNASHWHTQIPNYAKVKYSGVYPGIDLVYYGNQQQLEYDFVVAPGADPKAIALDFKGVDGLSVNASGDLVLSTGDGNVVQHKPVIYQDVGGQRRPIEGSYVVNGTKASFKVAAYDVTRPLVIDPTLAYATFFGGKDFDYGNSIAVDSQGYPYVVGFFYACEYPTTMGQWRNSTGAGDIVVLKLSRDGSQLVYANVLGGDSQDVGRGIAVDSKGSAYVTGYTRSHDFPTTRGALKTSLGKGATQNAFVARFDAYGQLSYSTYLGGTASDTGQSIAVDSSDDAYVTGFTSSSDFPATTRAVQKTLAGLQNAFVTKLNSNGSALVYSTFLGGDDYDFGYGIAVNSAGNAYVTGTTYGIYSSTFPVTSNAYQTASSGSGDAFVAKLSTDGSSLVYSTFLGGTGYDGARGIALDANGYAYITGYTQSTDFPTTAGAVQIANGTGKEPFVAVLNATGAQLSYSTYLGGSNGDGAYGIAVDSSNNAYITGYTNSADFPATSKAWRPQFVSSASQDGFVAKISLAN